MVQDGDGDDGDGGDSGDSGGDGDGGLLFRMMSSVLLIGLRASGRQVGLG